MADKPVKIPGPDHPISIDANPSRVVVTLGGKVIADTRDALTLREASYPDVQYIPRRDADFRRGYRGPKIACSIERPADTAPIGAPFWPCVIGIYAR